MRNVWNLMIKMINVWYLSEKVVVFVKTKCLISRNVNLNWNVSKRMPLCHVRILRNLIRVRVGVSTVSPIKFDFILIDSADVPTFKKLSMSWVGHTKHYTQWHTFWINTKAPFQDPWIHTTKTLPSLISLMCCRMRVTMNSIVFSCPIVSMEEHRV